jgi:hypothetical protein
MQSIEVASQVEKFTLNSVQQVLTDRLAILRPSIKIELGEPSFEPAKESTQIPYTISDERGQWRFETFKMEATEWRSTLRSLRDEEDTTIETYIAEKKAVNPDQIILGVIEPYIVPDSISFRLYVGPTAKAWKMIVELPHDSKFGTLSVITPVPQGEKNIVPASEYRYQSLQELAGLFEKAIGAVQSYRF